MVPSPSTPTENIGNSVTHADRQAENQSAHPNFHCSWNINCSSKASPANATNSQPPSRLVSTPSDTSRRGSTLAVQSWALDSQETGELSERNAASGKGQYAATATVKKPTTMSKYVRPGRQKKVKRACLSSESIAVFCMGPVLVTDGISRHRDGRHTAAIGAPIRIHANNQYAFSSYCIKTSIMPSNSRWSRIASLVPLLHCLAGTAEADSTDGTAAAFAALLVNRYQLQEA